MCIVLMGCNCNLWATEVVAEEPDSSELLPEVTVSAIKQTSDLNKFPTALTVLNSNHIEQLGVDAIKNVSAIAPNFFIPDYGSRMTSSVYVRGIGARIDIILGIELYFRALSFANFCSPQSNRDSLRVVR